MPYQVTVERQAQKYLTGLRDARLLRRLREALAELAAEPRAPGSVKLQGEGELCRVFGCRSGVFCTPREIGRKPV